MLISEAMVMLAPYGVERIERVVYPHATTPTWRVTDPGGEWLYGCELETLVWFLTQSDDEEG